MKKSQVMALVIALALLGFSCARKDSSEASNSGSKGASAASDNSSKSAQVKEATASDFVYEWTDDRQGVRIRKYIGSKTDVLVIPATIEGLPVRKIQNVSDADSTEIVLPKSVTRIGKAALPSVL
jgi:hypothetical protein